MNKNSLFSDDSIDKKQLRISPRLIEMFNWLLAGIFTSKLFRIEFKYLFERTGCNCMNTSFETSDNVAFSNRLT